MWIDPKTKDAIWRGTSMNGIYLIGEGEYGRVMKAMDRQERDIKGVTAGSSIPVYRIAVGHGPKQVPLTKLRSTVIKSKSYEPTHHKNALIAKNSSAPSLPADQGRDGNAERSSSHAAGQEGLCHPQGHGSEPPAEDLPPRDARSLIGSTQPNRTEAPESVQSVPGLRHMSHNRVHIHPPTSPVNTHCPRCGHLYLLPR